MFLINNLISVSELPNGWSLFDEESYVQWRLPPKTRNQLLHFEFRTRERKTQVMAMEFDLKSYAFLFSLDSGRGTIQLGSEQYFFVHPDMANGEWHAVTVDFQKPLITLDHLYKKVGVLEYLHSFRSARHIRF